MDTASRVDPGPQLLPVPDPAERAAPLPQASAKLESIQILRAIAAALVVVWHLEMLRLTFPEAAEATRLPQFLQFGYAGVELFFLLSGYIIMYVTDRSRFDTRSFLVKRWIRIYPTYLAFTMIPIATLVLFPGMRSEGALGFAEVLASVAILPQFEAPLLGPGWTLEHEIIFYGAVAVLLALGRRRWILPLLFFAGGVGIVLHGLLPMLGYPDPWDWHLFSPFQLGFATGALIYEKRHSIGRFGTWTPLLLGLVFTSLCAVGIEPYRTGAIWTGNGVALLFEILGYSLSFSLVMIGMLNLEAAGGLRKARRLVSGLVLVGDASYVLYLFNYVLLLAAMKLLPPLGLPGRWLPLYMLVAFALCIVASVAMHLCIERPFLARFNRWFEPRSPRN